jgi:hypothetical protein
MSDKTTAKPLLSEDLRTWKHHGHELKAHRIESLAQHAEQMEADRANPMAAKLLEE